MNVRARRARSAHTAYLAHEFDRVAEALGQARIPVVALKGIYLSQAVHDDMAMRPFSDVDILCRKRDVSRLTARLCSLGYRPPPPNLMRWYERCYHNMPFSHAGPIPFFMDVHWAVAPKFRFAADTEELFERSSPWKGEFVRALAPEDTLLHLAVHAAQSAFHLSDAQWSDFEAVLARLPVDAGTLFVRARAWGALSTLSAALFAAARRAAPAPRVEALASALPLSPKRKTRAERAVLAVAAESFLEPGWRAGLYRERLAWRLSDSTPRAWLAAAHKAWTRLLHGAEPVEEVRRAREKLWTRVTP